MKNVTKVSMDMILTIAILVAATLSGCHGDGRIEKVYSDAHLSGFMADMWLEGADVIKILWRDCAKKLIDVKDVIDHKEYFPKFIRCMKRKTLRALDRSLSTDVVPLTDGMNLVRFELVDKTGNVMNDSQSSSWSESELEEGEWRSLALQRMAKVLRTHVIKFDFGTDGNPVEKAEFRGRRRHQMMTMMMFGIVSLGMVFIPMGFQFLAVLGGKAIFLAKMALILASIQGLRKVDHLDGYHERPKIATNPLNYGFYHSYPYEHLEKRSVDRTEPSAMSGTSPPTSMPFSSMWDEDSPNKNNKYDRIALPSIETKESILDKIKWKPERPKPVKTESESRIYPVYVGPTETSPMNFFSAIDQPTSLADLTTRPSEVQADYTLELPYNGFRFQSPTPVVSA